MLNEYIKLLKQNKSKAAAYVETLNKLDRIKLREQLVKQGCKQLMRNLYYDYKTQQWI